MRTDSIEYGSAVSESLDHSLGVRSALSFGVPPLGGRASEIPANRRLHTPPPKGGTPNGENAGVPRVEEAAESDVAKRIGQCIAFMLQHLNQPLQVATLAARANTSPSHFFVLFKRFAGSSPIDYFIRLRMRRACQLLQAGSLHVKEVAAALGYDDPFYFSRVFKSTVHVAPSEYRAIAAVTGRTHSTVENGACECNGSSPQFGISARAGNNGWNKRIRQEKNRIVHSQNGFAQR